MLSHRLVFIIEQTPDQSSPANIEFDMMVLCKLPLMNEPGSSLNRSKNSSISLTSEIKCFSLALSLFEYTWQKRLMLANRKENKNPKF